MIFDLDGTLVQTERLKALSYARAALELCSFDRIPPGHAEDSPRSLSEADVVEAFKDVVGLPRREVAQALIERFGLFEAAHSRMEEFGVSVPWQAFVQVRMQFYDKMLADPEVLRKNQWPHNVALLQQARRTGCKTALATMSRCRQAQRVLEILDLAGEFDFVVTRDDVEQGKPNPEIYQVVARELDVRPSGCLVIEDSPSGVKAALAAGMWCIAVTTPFTRKAIHAGQYLDERWIVDDPVALPDIVRQMAAERQGDQEQE